MEDSEITFYNTSYCAFSNFYPSPFEFNSKHYPTAEHFYQSMKFQNTPLEETIRIAPSIETAHILGQSPGKIRKDWDEIRESVYFQAILLKFQQNEKLKNELISTGSKKIICVDSDLFWGAKKANGEAWEGENVCGKLLEKARDTIKNEKK